MRRTSYSVGSVVCRGGLLLGLCVALAGPAAGEVLFQEDFESGILAPCWATNSTGQGRLRVTEDWTPAGGVRHVVMDDFQSDLVSSRNELVLTVDLGGQSNVVLSFQHKSLNDEDHEMPDSFGGSHDSDGVAVSDDGGTTWHKIQGLTSSNFTASGYKSFEVPLTPGAAWSLVDDFKIKFQQYDDSPAEEDGFALDDILLETVSTAPGADLTLTLGALFSGQGLAVSNEYPLLLTLVNKGPREAVDVTITNRLPAGVELVTATLGYEVDPVGHAVLYRLAEMAAGQTSRFWMICSPGVTGLCVWTSVVTSAGADTNAADNTAAYQTTFGPRGEPAADIGVEVTLSDAACLSQPFTNTVHLENYTAEYVSNVLIVSEFSAPVEILDGYFRAHSNQLCSSLTLTPSWGAFFSYRVRATREGLLTNIVRISAARSLASTNGLVFTNVIQIIPDSSWEQVLDGYCEGRYLAGAYSGGADDSQPALADMDADGDPDAFIGSADKLMYYRNIGTSNAPAWAPPVLVRRFWSNERHAPAPADLDGDGDLDLLVGRLWGNLMLIENEGTATNAAWGEPQYSYGGIDVDSTSVPALADVDGDGDPDLFVGNGDGDILVYTNTGTAASAAWSGPYTNFPCPIPNYAYAAPRLADLDGDGDFDLAAGYDPYPSRTNAFWLYWANTGTVFQPRWAPFATQELGVAAAHYFASFAPAFADLDGDGDLDACIGQSQGRLDFVANLGQATQAVWLGRGERVFLLDLPSPQIAGGDLDGDGDGDLLVKGPHDPHLWLYENAGTPLLPIWHLATTNYLNWTGGVIYGMTFCDIDADDDPDLLVNTADLLDDTRWIIMFLENTGTAAQASWAAPVHDYLVLNAATGHMNYGAVAAGDMDDDGDFDLFIKGWITNGPLLYIQNTGTAAAAAWAPPADPGVAWFGGNYHTPLILDMDEDGDHDLIGMTGRDWVFYPNTGDAQQPRWSLPRRLYAPVDPFGLNDFVQSGAAMDLDADGDLDLLFATAEGGLLFYRNQAEKLQVIPGQRPLEPGAGCDFNLTNGSPAAWQFVVNRSGGTLDPATGAYQAGPTQALDIVESRLADGRYGRAFVQVISNSLSAGQSRAIVMAGSKTAVLTDDPAWEATDYLADLAFNALRARGYSKGSMAYLSPMVGQDVDGDGYPDVTRATTRANAEWAFQTFAPGASNLFVYLVDHGATNEGGGYFRLNSTEILAATNLSAWLDGLQDVHGMDVTVVLDFCQAGSFLAPLAYTGAAARIVIAGAGPAEAAYFVAGGLVSFSEAFFHGVRLGLGLGESFRVARRAMSDYQDAWLDADKDGRFDEGVDDAAGALDLPVGVSIGGEQGAPQVGLIADNQYLDGDSAATLWAANVSAGQPIDRVWCVVVPPGYQPDPDVPIASLPEIELIYAGGRYEAQYTGFGQAGTYKIIYYAHAQGGGVSLPKYGYVTQAGANERAILVAGGTTNLALWTNINSVANGAWETLLARQFTTATVCYLSMDAGQPGVDGAVSLEAVGQAITNWAGDSKKLTLVLVGEATNDLLRLAEGEDLDALQLDAWLDAYQESNRTVIAAMDFAGAGSFITNMTTPPGRERILIAGAGPGEPAVCEQSGWISFTRVFFSHVFDGRDVLESFRAARDIVFNLTRGAQDPQLDDNGNGVPNEKDVEGAAAQGEYLGSAFVTGAEAPVIGAVTLDTVLAGTNALVLWASEIVAAAGVDRAWCVVAPPSDAEDSALVTVDLAWSAGESRYEAACTNFTEPGVYICTFFAMDYDGVIGAPRQAQVFSADRYEPDNSADDARPFEIAGVQVRNFHVAGDEDWVGFFLVTNYVYELRTRQLGTNVDSVVDLYRVLGDGSLSNVVHQDLQGAGAGQGEYLLLEHRPAGLYLARVTAYRPWQAGLGTEYEVRIHVPAAPSTTFLCILGADLHDSDRSPPGAVAWVDGAPHAFSGGRNLIELTGIAAKTYTITVTAPGCLPAQHASRAGQVEDQNNQAYGNPRRVRVRSGAFVAAPFLLEPCVRVKGVARDAATGKRLKNASLAFAPNSSSGLPCSRYDGYPGYASYRRRWLTAPDGQFPTNVYLPPRAGWLTVTADGYSNAAFYLNLALPNGSTNEAGELPCGPVVTNAGGLPNRWINLHFGGPTNILAMQDTDEDGQSNWNELLTDTDPNDPDSVFALFGAGVGFMPAGLRLQWSGVEGHAYQVAGCSNLWPEAWSVVGGPWTNWDNSAMEWTSPEPAGRGLYRLEEFRP
ncbi:MAG: VCBS repeat-containing protein [Kiritimatiellae bacterium]|nr:VCBS repeat-containing protein [Kiritimatiellia bacterium]